MIVVDYSTEDYTKTLRIIENNKEKELALISQTLELLKGVEIDLGSIDRILNNQHFLLNSEDQKSLVLKKLLEKTKEKGGKTRDFKEEIKEIQDLYSNLKETKALLEQTPKFIDWTIGFLFIATEIENIPNPLKLFSNFLENKKVSFEVSENSPSPTFNFYTKYSNDFWEEYKHCVLKKEVELLKKFGLDLNHCFLNDLEQIIKARLSTLIEQSSEVEHRDYFFCINSPLYILEKLQKIEIKKKNEFSESFGILLKTEIVEIMGKKDKIYSYLPREAIDLLIGQKFKKDKTFAIQSPVVKNT